MKMLQKAVIEFWSEVGMPSRIIFFRSEKSARRLDRLRRIGASILKRKRMTAMAEAACAMMVARATPATPMWKTRTKRRSKKRLIIEMTIRKKKGSLELPTARRMLEPVL